MLRSLASLLFLPLCCASPALADELTPIERQLAVQNAMARARQFLLVEEPIQAVEVLEATISRADGNPAFLALLKQAYYAEYSYRTKEPRQNADASNCSGGISNSFPLSRHRRSE